MSQTHRTRREFARDAALLAATAAVAPRLLAQSEKTPAPVKPPQPPEKKEEELSATAKAEVENAYKMLMDRFSGRFTDAQEKDIRRLLTQQQKGIEALRAFPLDNSNEPATVLHLER